MNLGKRFWAIPEGYLPAPGPNADDRALRSHESVCILNTGDQAADVQLTIYFADREPVGPYRVKVEARRTLHLRFDDLKEPEPIPRETEFASVIEASSAVVVQHTRLDARKSPFALLSTMAYGTD